MTEEYENYLIVTVGRLIGIKAKGKGSVHKNLRGMYTSRGEASKAIDTYLRGKSNGKTKSTD